MRTPHLLLLALPLTSCAKLGELAKLDQYTPKIAFEKVDLSKADWNGADADFVFRVSNPNPIKVKVASFRYDLDIDGNGFLDGTNADGMQLEAQGDSQLKLPVALKWTELVDTASGLKGKDSVPFTIAGAFGFDTPIGPLEVPYEHSGDLPVLRPPKVRLAGARVAKLDVLKNTARLEVDLGLQNQGANSLTFSGLDYQLSLSGTRVADGLVDTVGAVAGDAEKTVTLPIDLKLLELGTTVVNAIVNKERIQVGVKASVDVQTPLGTLPLSIDESGRLQLK